MIRTRAHDIALALRDYVSGSEDVARLSAYQIARDAMANGIGLLDVVADHHEALGIVLTSARNPEESVGWVRASADLLTESLGPFEMAQRGFQEANATLIRLNGDLERQVTERERAEEAARAAKQEAEGANRAKSDFLSRMSHELRTPLNAVLGFAQLLEMEDLKADQRESVEQIVKAGRHLLDLINEVLDIARVESGRLEIAVEPVRIDEMLREVVELVSPLATDRNVQLIGAPQPTPRYVRADRKRLRQVLLNLLSNAIKYNRDGGTVTTSWEELPNNGRLRLVVTDTGPGIDPGKMARLFSPFDRLGAEMTEVEGTGLGLALSMVLVEAMGGKLDVRSEVGVGSSFTVDLPLAIAGIAE
jgi:signal transduction histidine kinase